MIKNTESIKIRLAKKADYDVIADVMFDAVRHGRSDYTNEQRQAWVPQPRRGQQWVKRLDSQSVFVAENSGQIFGFMTLATNGYIDFAYLRPSAQGSGIFRRIYEAIEQLAVQSGEPRLWVHASLMAQPAFTAMGFSIVQEESVEIGGYSFQRYEMEKHLDVPVTAIKA